MSPPQMTIRCMSASQKSYAELYLTIHSRDTCDGHGTHVSGILAGQNVNSSVCISYYTETPSSYELIDSLYQRVSRV